MPFDAVGGEEPVVFHHTRNSVERCFTQEGRRYPLEGFNFTTPVRHRHHVETYGLTFSLPGGRVSPVSDASFRSWPITRIAISWF